MPSSENKTATLEEAAHIITHFEELFNTLLENYTAYQQHIAQLTKENALLKSQVQDAQHSPDSFIQSNKTTQSVSSFDAWEQQLMQQINVCIKDIDFCLTYFEQT
ncbi:MAG: hypothetical protein NQ127_03835 [Candidatus Cardinium sp.]|nr:hypothetical protein [Candidatus Cardinium sp.]